MDRVGWLLRLAYSDQRDRGNQAHRVRVGVRRTAKKDSERRKCKMQDTHGAEAVYLYVPSMRFIAPLALTATQPATGRINAPFASTE
jgi:hypothetical protein